MRNASSSNREGFDSPLNVYREVNTVQEKERILRKIEKLAFSGVPLFSVSCLDESNLDFFLDVLTLYQGFFPSSPDPVTVLEVLNFFASLQLLHLNYFLV